MSKRHIEDPDSDRSARGRSGRSPFAWLPRLGMELLAFFADADGGGAGAAPAAAPPCGGPITKIRCCFLACPHTECRYSGNKYDYVCPEGYNKTFWFCTEGREIIGCGECSGGTNCRSGPFNCSIWWTVQTC